MNTGFKVVQQNNADLGDLFMFKLLKNLWGWGYNYYGQLGTNDAVYRSSPVQTIAVGANWKSISCGDDNIAAIKTDGTLWVWGSNAYGKLGTNNTTNYSSPVQTIAGGTNWKSVSCGVSNTATIKTDGTLWLWGRNLYGSLGTNNLTIYSSPVQTILGGTDWQSVSCGSAHTGAIKTDGTLWMWGYNSNGELGLNNNWAHRSSPVQTIAGGTNWQSISCGTAHTGAIKTDGTLWMWGDNSSGRLGTNDTTDKLSPVQTTTGGTNWQSVSCGTTHTGAIKTDGTLWLWGYNPFGQLGTNNQTSYSSPVQTICGGTNWKSVSCGGSFTGVIKTDGTLWMWGYNTYGELGTNDIVHRSSPVQTVAGGTNWKLVSCGEDNTGALTYY